ncbi:MAG: polysaccharide biosynthesis tyrosine autokinase, partial [Spiribacter salinus]
LTRLKETTVQRGLNQADSRIISEGIIGEKVAPRTTLIAALSLVLGGMVGMAIVLIRQYMHNGFRSAEELEGATGLPVLGQIPKMPFKAREGLIGYLHDKPTSAAAEAVRNLRTSLLLSDIDNPPQVIMSTSSLPGEGKTTHSIALAQNLVGLNKKVLLIEGDIRRRTLNKYFDDVSEGGILTALSGDKPLNELVLHDDRIGADVLMGEESRVNAADLFSSDRFRDFLDHVRHTYDYVIIDTPPVLVVPDSRVIGQYVDAILFSVAWDRTNRAQVMSALRELESAKLRVTGVVLAQIDPKGMRRYGYGDAHGAYGAYGKGYYDAT